jgi:hypothetical protein
MLRRLRENGPGLLVPLAWTFVTAAHLDLVATRTLLIAHVVMDVLLLAFAVLSYDDMREGVLRVWLAVIVVGLVITVAGTASFFFTEPLSVTQPAMRSTLQTLAVAGWMFVPAVALVYTGLETPAGEAGWVYTAGGGLSLLGLLVYLGSLTTTGSTTVLIAGLTLVNVGQTAGILNAVYQY